MAQDQRPSEQFHRSGELLGERRLAFHHLLRNACERRYTGTDSPLRIDQLLVFRDLFAVLVADDTQLDHAMTEVSRRPGRLDVQARQWQIVQGLEEGKSHSVAN